MKRIWGLIVVLSLISACNNEEKEGNNGVPEVVVDSTSYLVSVYQPIKNDLEKYFKGKHDSTLFYGNVLFAKRGHIIYKDSFGVANYKTKDSLTLNHTFQLASASKPFTAVATLQLVDKGLIKLEDTVGKFIPNFPFYGRTVEQLLTHRSGFSQYTHFCDAPDSIWPDKFKTIHNDDVLEIIEEIQPMPFYGADTKFYYSNTNYLLLASIIERVTKMKFEEYLQKYIFDPCKMESTVLYQRDNKDKLILPTVGYNGAYNPMIDIYLNGCVGDKGIYTNVYDFYNFDRALFNGDLISKNLLDSAITPKNPTFKTNQSYGYGFRMIEVNNEWIPFHTGWWKGYRTYYIHEPKSDVTIIVLTHVKRGPFLHIEELVNLVRE